jgi:hypothetical protein
MLLLAFGYDYILVMHASSEYSLLAFPLSRFGPRAVDIEEPQITDYTTVSHGLHGGQSLHAPNCRIGYWQ